MHKIRSARALALSVPLALAVSGTLVSGAGAATSLAPDSPNVTILSERQPAATAVDSYQVVGLDSGESLEFDNGAGAVTTLTMREDGTLTLTRTGLTAPIWSIVTGASGAALVVGADGNFGIWDNVGDRLAWQANTANNEDSGGTVELRDGALVVTHDGDVVFTNGPGEFFDGYPKTDDPGDPGDPGDGAYVTLSGLAVGEQAVYTNAAGEVTTLTMQPDGTLVLAKDGTTITQWKTGVPGTTLRVGDDGSLTLWDNTVGTWAWRTGGGHGSSGTAQLRDGALVVEDDFDVHFDNGPGRYNDGYPKTDDPGDPGDPGQVTEVTDLAGGESIALPGGGRLSMQGDGNLVLYDEAGKATFNTGTFVPGSRLVTQSDGNVVVYDPSGRWVWQSGTSGNPGATVVLDDGRLLVRNGDTTVFDSATDKGTRNSPHVTSMRAGSSLSSADGTKALRMQSDGNLVLYQGARPLWNSGTHGNSGARLVVQGDGNVVIYSATNVPLWHTGTHGNPGARLVLQNDGNLVLYTKDDKPLWWTMR